MDSYLIAGQTVELPVRIRSARCFVAGFTADAGAVRDAIAERGDVRLEPLRIRAERAVCMLVFVEYLDGDLGPYHEFGVCFLLDDPAAPTSSRAAALRALARGDAHALIHELPVDGEFTLAAGRGIWGFPKIMAEFDVDHDSATKHGAVSVGGRLIADLTVRPGIPMPSSASTAVLQSYSQLDGITRRTLIELAKRAGYKIVERHIKPDELGQFEECFLTGTAAEVTPVSELGDLRFTPGKACQTLIEAYSAEVMPRQAAAE